MALTGSEMAMTRRKKRDHWWHVTWRRFASRVMGSWAASRRRIPIEIRKGPSLRRFMGSQSGRTMIMATQTIMTIRTTPTTAPAARAPACWRCRKSRARRRRGKGAAARRAGPRRRPPCRPGSMRRTRRDQRPPLPLRGLAAAAARARLPPLAGGCSAARLGGCPGRRPVDLAAAAGTAVENSARGSLRWWRAFWDDAQIIDGNVWVSITRSNIPRQPWCDKTLKL
mmetsp:Transcript_7486/g.18581  ORF Transcript_7486/g.18581 Transcript_7486/m.18581 type:complete len:226 (+) Transcript_7486:292-969(+)